MIYIQYDSNGDTYSKALLLKQCQEAVTRRCSVKKGVLKNFAKFTGKQLCQSLFLIKLQASGTGVFL